MILVVVPVTFHVHPNPRRGKHISSHSLNCGLVFFGFPTKHIAVWSYVGSFTLHGYEALSLCPMQHIKTCNLGKWQMADTPPGQIPILVPTHFPAFMFPGRFCPQSVSYFPAS